MKGEARTMETTMTREPIWKLWVDTQRRVVSFHEEAGSQLMEFRDREMFLRCMIWCPACDSATSGQHRNQTADYSMP